MSRPPTLWLLGAGLVALVAAGQSLHDGSTLRIGSDTTMIRFVALQMAAVGLYFASVGLVCRGEAPRGVWLVLGVAVAMRAIPLASPMFLSSDLFRYIWDGRVQLAGINPYRYLPVAPELAPLRDIDVFTHVWRGTYAHTIYPPMAEMVFAGVAWISQTDRAMRLAMVAFEAVAVAALLRALVLRGDNPARILIYAWNPLAVWEFAGNGHVDAIAIGLLSLALLGRVAGRPAATGVALAGAILAKFLPVVVAPALWQRGEWRLPLATGLTIAVLYGCYAGVGLGVFGFMPGYADEEGMADGSGIWALAGLSHLVTLPARSGAIWLVCVALGFAIVGLAALRQPAADPARSAGWLALAAMLAITPHYPWYYPWLAVPAVLAPARANVWLGSAAILLYLSPLHERFVWPALVFAPALMLAAIDLCRGRLAVPTLALVAGK